MQYEMKDSGVDWIGKVPEHWQLTDIGSLYTQRNERVSDKDYEPLSVTKKGILPQLSTVAKTDDGDNRKLVKSGDFVINSRSDRRGSCGISLCDGSVSLINTVLSPRGKMYPGYFDWLFHTEAFADEFYKWGHGIVDDLWTTRWTEMKQITIPIPEFMTQTEIAVYLDEKCSAIDEIIEEAKASIEEYKAWKSSVIFEAVTKGLNPDAEMKDSGVEWIGKVPKHWKQVPVKNLAVFINGFAFSSDWLIPEASYPVIRIGDIDDNGNVNFNHALGIDDTTENLTGFTIRKNDVLIAMSGATTGKVGFIKNNPPAAFINQRVGIIRSDKHNKYLFYCLSTNMFKEYVSLLSAGSAQPNLSTEGIKNYKIMCPPDNELDEITSFDTCSIGSA